MKSHKPLRTRLAVALGVSALLFAGCADSSSDKNDKSSDGNKSSGDLSMTDIYTTGLVNADNGGEPKKGGVLTVAQYSEPRSMDPTKTYGNGAAGGDALVAVYDTLMRYDFDSGKFEPKLAKSLTSSKGDTVWTLKLRDGVKFSDGTPLDAQAVVDSLKYYTDNYGYQGIQLLQSVASTKVVDDSTVQFVTRLPYAAFPDLLSTGPGMIMAPAAYKDPAAFKPIGAGPFLFDKYSPGEELTLKANPDYVDGAPNLDGLRFVWLGADEAKLDSLSSGGVDMAFMRGNQAVVKARNDGYSGMMFVSGMGSNFWINAREGAAGDDVRVRQAIDYAIDPQIYLDRVSGGAGIASKQLMPETSPWYTDVQVNGPDVDKAKDLLAEAKNDGYDGKITYIHAADPVSTGGAVAVKGMLEAAGFSVTLEPIRNIADQIKRIYVDHDYDLANAAVTIPDEDPYLRLAGTLGAQSPTNASGYSSPEMDKLLAQLAAAHGPDEGKATLGKIAKLWMRDVPGVGVSVGGTFLPWNDDVHGVVPTTENLVFYEDAWKD